MLFRRFSGIIQKVKLQQFFAHSEENSRAVKLMESETQEKNHKLKYKFYFSGISRVEM